MTTHETGLKAKQRGWYSDPSPGLKDVKGKFDDAERHANAIKVAAMATVLAKLGVFQNSPDPVQAFTHVLRTQNFGYGKDIKSRPGNMTVFDGNDPKGSGFGDQQGATSYENYGGV